MASEKTVLKHLTSSKTADLFVCFFSDATLRHQIAPLQAKEKQRQLYPTRFVLKESILCSADFLTSTSYHTHSAQFKGAC